ncbi:TPA: hypothetical protein ACMFQN_005213 [Pseudomonas aeruginosa]
MTMPMDEVLARKRYMRDVAEASLWRPAHTNGLRRRIEMVCGHVVHQKGSANVRTPRTAHCSACLDLWRTWALGGEGRTTYGSGWLSAVETWDGDRMEPKRGYYLRPCPCCGSAVKVHSDVGLSIYAHLECTGCYLRSRQWHVGRALREAGPIILQWNSRSVDDAFDRPENMSEPPPRYWI